MGVFETNRVVPPDIDTMGVGSADAIHDASIQILEEIGVELNHERARALVTDHGGAVDRNDVATLPRSLVEDCLDLAPSSFRLHARNPDRSVTVGRETVRAPAYGPSNVLTEDGDRRPSTLCDYEDLLKLVQTADPITCTGYCLCEPTDVGSDAKHVEMLKRSLTLTDKPVIGSAYGAKRARDSLEMVGIAVGDRDLDRPYVAGLINTTPPRSIEQEMLGGLLTYADYGQPCIVSSFTMAGASGSHSLPTALAQANAENLVAITLAQLANPGVPVVYGLPIAAVDGRHGSLSVGGPESALFVTFAGRMGEYYGLPSRAGGGLTDAKTVGYQSGAESALVQTTTTASGIDFVLNAAGILASYSTVSLEKFLLDCETLRTLDWIRDSRRIDGERIDLDRIAEVEPAGHFLENQRDESAFYQSEIADKRSYEDWAGSEQSTFERASEAVDRRLDRYEKPDIDTGVELAVEDFVRQHRETR